MPFGNKFCEKFIKDSWIWTEFVGPILIRRLDFEEFSIAQPKTLPDNGGVSCVDEYFYVLGNFEPVALDVNHRICGDMTGQHGN